MSLRISSAVLLLALAACSKPATPEAEALASGLATVPCALGGAKTYTATCVVERADQGGKAVLTLRHPDGGFRRLIELDGGRRFAAADGFDEVAAEPNGQEIEVTLGDDHYLMPAPSAVAAQSSNAAKP